MIAFRLSATGCVEWTNNAGQTWQDQTTLLPSEVLRDWWTLLGTIVGATHEETAHAPQ